MDFDSLMPHQRRAVEWYAELKASQATADPYGFGASSVQPNKKREVLQELLRSEKSLDDICLQYTQYLDLQRHASALPFFDNLVKMKRFVTAHLPHRKAS